MDATTMDAATTGVPVNEAPKTHAGSVLKPVAAALRGAWWVGLGTAVVIGEQTARLVTALAERGKEVEPALIDPLRKAPAGVSAMVEEAGAALKEAGRKIGRGAEKMEGALDQRIAAALERREGPLREDVRNLASVVEELARKVEQIAFKRENKREESGQPS